MECYSHKRFCCQHSWTFYVVINSINDNGNRTRCCPVCIGNHTTLSSIWNLFPRVYFSKSIKIPDSTERMPFELFKKRTMCTNKLQIEEEVMSDWILFNNKQEKFFLRKIFHQNSLIVQFDETITQSLPSSQSGQERLWPLIGSI